MLTRRTAAKAVAAASVGPFFAFGQQPKRNLLFLCSDQHQTAATGCYGSTEVQTPHIDWLAAESIRFESAFCQSPVCVPSRGSIISGLYPHHHGALILADALSEEVPTVADLFAGEGYQTAAIGKMHFVDESRRHGFQHRIYSADFNRRLTAGEFKALRRDQGGAGGTNGVRSRLPERLFQDTFYAEETIDYLRQNRDKRFCVWSSFHMPHTPLVPFGDYWDLYDPDSLTLPERSAKALESGFVGHLIRARERGWYQQTDDELRLALAGYYGNTSQMDANVGRVLDTLEELGLLDNTVVVYTSDHGEMAGAHRMWTKHNMFEQSVSVPLMIRTPDGLGAGTARRELIEQVDLLPTLAELCGIKAPKVDGRSFAGLVRGESYKPREFAFSQYDFCNNVFTRDDRYVGRPPILMARTERYKLNYLSWERSELFDLEKDPNEFHNAIDDPGNAGIVKELEATVRKVVAA